MHLTNCNLSIICVKRELFSQHGCIFFFFVILTIVNEQCYVKRVVCLAGSVLPTD